MIWDLQFQMQSRTENGLSFPQFHEHLTLPLGVNIPPPTPDIACASSEPKCHESFILGPGVLRSSGMLLAAPISGSRTAVLWMDTPLGPLDARAMVDSQSCVGAFSTWEFLKRSPYTPEWGPLFCSPKIHK